jgi:glycosyltransferase involved in cell wall biosynthesis
VPYIYGGGEYVFFEWGKELSKRGHEIVTITQNIRGVKSTDYFDGIKVHRIGNFIEPKGQLPPSIIDNLSYLLLSIIKGIQILRKNKVSVIHSNSYTPILSGYICSKIFRIPHVVTFHDLYIGKHNFWSIWSKQKGVSIITRFIAPFFERFLLYINNDVIHTVSKTSKKDIDRYNRRLNTIVIPNGIDPYIYKLNYQNNEKNIALYIGRLTFYKNIDTLINAFNNLNKNNSDYKLYIIGDGPYKEILMDKSKENTNIIFTGRISEKLKIKLINKSKFLMLPSLVEGFGIVILEAYACKKPVLVSNVMPLPEIVRDRETGFLISPFDSETWANKILFLFNNDIERKRLGKNGYNLLIKEFTIEKIVDKIEILYKSLISNNLYQ